MEIDQPQPASDRASDTEVIDLAAVLSKRRQELGVVVTEAPPKLPLMNIPRQLSADEIAAREAAIAADEEYSQRAARSMSMTALLVSAGSDFDRCRFSTYEATRPAQKEVLAFVRQYADSLPERVRASEGLVLYGPVGTGKDHLAFAVCRVAILKHGYRVRWVNGMDWTGRIRDAMDAGGENEATMIRDLVSPDLLCISDPLPPFGPLGQHMATMLYRVLNKRGKSGKPTIVTVNVADDAEADERMGVATWDRVKERAWVAPCRWQSHRSPAREIKP